MADKKQSAQSQWDFGELTSPKAPRQVLSVGELTSQIKKLLEDRIGGVWVSGEITNLRAQSSGHLYFSLKDRKSQLNCVLFRSVISQARDVLEDGTQVILQGELTVYEPRGQYQLRVTAIELQGIGALQQAFEKLKRKLNSEGLFDAARKRPLPRIATRIGLVTSVNGAALRDVVHVIQRRQPFLKILLAPCRVQGTGAADEIAGAIQNLNEWANANQARLDLILVTRGGGSLEDLWAFNEETLARAIFHSERPVVSAVGHEIDFTIADFVADVRAATPSAAAEMITTGTQDGREILRQAPARLLGPLRQKLRREGNAKRFLLGRMQRAHPRRRLNESLQRLDDLKDLLQRQLLLGYRTTHTDWVAIHQRWQRATPRAGVARRRELAKRLANAIEEKTRQNHRHMRVRQSELETRLRLLSPQQILARGYSITVQAETGKVIRRTSEVAPGAKIVTRLHVGRIHSTVDQAEA